MGRRVERNRRRLCIVQSRICGGRARRFKSPSGEGTGCEESSKASATERDCGFTSQASMPSRIPCNSAVSCGRFWWQTVRSRSQWSYSHPDLSWFEPSDLLCLEQALRQPHSYSGHASSRGPSKRRCASSSRPRTCRSTCNGGSSSGQAQKLALSRGGIRSGAWCGVIANGVDRSSQRQRIRRRQIQRLSGHAQVQRILRTRHEYPGVIIAAHETTAREDLATLTGESWSCLHQCGHFRTLRRATVMISGPFDECRVGGFEWQHAMWCLIYAILEYGTKDTAP